MPTAEIIAAGTELTSGQKLDTNSLWLAGQLRDRGVDVRFHTTVGDALSDNIDVVRRACERCEIVVMTGGLGPTLDDITRDALAAVMDEPLITDADALHDLEAFFVGRDRTMPERNRRQATRPESATMLANPLGTAPGVLARVARGASHEPSIFAAMPGVPSEMKPMFLNEVVPHLPLASTQSVLRLVHCYGLGESAAEEMLGELTARGRNPEVGITASSATITLRILATGPDKSECEQQADADAAVVRERLAKYVFGEGDDTLESVVVDRLRKRKQRVATAEAGTGGAVLTLLSQAAGYDGVFRGGFTVAATFDDEILSRPAPADPVSPEHAGELANVIRERLGSDYGVAAVCAPTAMFHAGSGERMTAYVAAASADETHAAAITLLGNPSIHAARIGKTALNLLLRKFLVS